MNMVPSYTHLPPCPVPSPRSPAPSPAHPHLLEWVGQPVDLEDEVLEGFLGGSLRAEEQPELLLRRRHTAVEHFKGFWNTAIYGDDQPQQLSL